MDNDFPAYVDISLHLMFQFGGASFGRTAIFKSRRK